MTTYCYEYPRPALTVDCVVFGHRQEGKLELLLIERRLEPFRGAWALPGGFVHMDETTDEAARRELAEETGLDGVFLEQLYTFGAVDRDPRDRVVTVAHYALVRPDKVELVAGSDAVSARWFPVDALPELAFDHARIVELAVERLRQQVRYRPIGFELLPEKFTLGALQRLYEAVLGRELDKRNFRRVISRMDILDELDELETGVSHRPSRLYRFNRKAYQRLLRQGFNFEI